STAISSASLHDALPISDRIDLTDQAAVVGDIGTARLIDAADVVLVEQQVVGGPFGGEAPAPLVVDGEGAGRQDVAARSLVAALRSEEHTSELQSREKLV